MSLDVAAGAIGVVSLGIQVCQGLLAYYDSWSEFHERTSATRASMSDLVKTLEVIQRVMNGPPLSVDVYLRVRESLDACKGGVGDLDKKLQKITSDNVGKTSLRDKAKEQFQRAAYPFRESTLMRIKEVVQDLRSNLHLTLEMLQIDLGTEILASHLDLNRRVNSMSLQVSTIDNNINSNQIDTNRREILHWLLKVDPSVRHHECAKLHEPSTGEWFLKTPEFTHWRTSQNSLMWLYGKAGSGKTILCYSAIEEIKALIDNDAKAAVAYFYFSFTKDSNQRIEDFLMSLLAQLFVENKIPAFLQNLYTKNPLGKPALSVIEQIFKDSVQDMGDIYVIIDGLDECLPDEGPCSKKEILLWLERLHAMSLLNLHILVGSRKESDINETLSLTLQSPSVCVEEASSQHDMAKYIATQIATDRCLKALKDSLKEEITTVLLNKADGMFRWIYCQIEELKRQKFLRPKDVNVALDSLPKTLDETYERILESKDILSYKGEVTTALKWLAYSEDDFTIDELAEAFILDIDSEPCVDEDDRFDALRVLEILSSLVIVYEGKDYLRGWGQVMSFVGIAHFSVKEYLLSPRCMSRWYAIEPRSSYEYLTRCCLGYITFGRDLEWTNLAEDSRKDEIAFGRFCDERFPLLYHASKNWKYYAKSSSNTASDELNDTMLRFLETTVNLHLMKVLEWDAGDDPLYIASMFGIKGLVENLILNGADINKAHGSKYFSPLQAAIAWNQELPIVQMLIDHGADVNAYGGCFHTALIAAAHFRNEEVGELLLDRGSDVNVVNKNCESALYNACSRGENEVVEILLNWNADVDLRNSNGSTALHAAAGSCSREVLGLILDKGADVNAMDDLGDTALHEACSFGNRDVVELLLDRGAKIDENERDGDTPLQFACYYARICAVDILLRKGADVHAKAGVYGNTLAAARDGYGDQVQKDRIVAMLVAAGATEYLDGPMQAEVQKMAEREARRMRKKDEDLEYGALEDMGWEDAEGEDMENEDTEMDDAEEGEASGERRKTREEDEEKRRG